MKKTIKNLNIWIEGTWCEVTDENGSFIYEGSVEESMTHEDVYKTLTARREFSLNGKVLTSYTIHGTFAGEREAVLENIAYENNCDIKDIEERVVVEDI